MSVYLDLRLLLAPTKAPTNLEIDISSATMAYAMWTGIPNDVQSAQGKLIGYKVSSDYFTSNGEFSAGDLFNRFQPPTWESRIFIKQHFYNRIASLSKEMFGFYLTLE